MTLIIILTADFIDIISIIIVTSAYCRVGIAANGFRFFS